VDLLKDLSCKDFVYGVSFAIFCLEYGLGVCGCACNHNTTYIYFLPEEIDIEARDFEGG